MKRKVLKLKSQIKHLALIAFVIKVNFLVMWLSVKKEKSFETLKINFISTVNPVLKMVSYPFYPLKKLSRNETKEQQTNEIEFLHLKTLEEREWAILSTLEAIKRLIFEVKIDSMKLVLTSPSYYSANGILSDVVIFAKTDEFIPPNSAVISSQGFFGRVSVSNGKKINIISIFDSNSRIPVYTKKSKVYGLAFGESDNIELLYILKNQDTIEEGEEVFTSNENGILTSDIPFGVIEKNEGRIFIKPFSERRPSIVGILIN
jgi:cell shape-determining protein MreC